MTLKYAPRAPDLTGKRRAQVQKWLERNIDQNNDIYDAMTSGTPGTYLLMRRWWHASPADPENHMLGNYYVVRVLVCTIGSETDGLRL